MGVDSMRDETLIHRLTAGITAEEEATLRHEVAVEWRQDLLDTDITLLCRLRDRFEHELAPHKDLLLRWMVTWAALVTTARMPIGMDRALLMVVGMSRDQFNELVAQQIRENFSGLKK